MNEEQIKAFLEEDEKEKSNALKCAISKRKTTLLIVINNLVKDIEILLNTAQEVKSIYLELLSKLYIEYLNLK